MVGKNKKGIISIAILATLLVSFVGFFAGNVKGQEQAVLIYATSDGPVDMDPANAWDSASSDVLDNVLETLVKYDLATPGLPIIPGLATDWSWNVAATELTMNLRLHVAFHNGNPFNASCVVWSFNRLMGLIHSATSQLGELYQVGGVDIINSVTAVTNLQVKFTLNFAYSPFLALLTFTGSSILAPGSAPVNDLLQYGNVSQNLIGTGPFMFANYTADDSVQMLANPTYWGGKPKVDLLVFDIINDANTRNQAMLNKECTFLADPLPSMKATFQNDTELHFQDGPTLLVIQYIGMNNRAINVTIRKAAAYAFNYTYALDQIMQGNGVRLHGPIPDGMMYYNGSVPYISQSVASARQILIDAGLAPGAQLTNNSYWTDRAGNLHGYTAIATVNFTYNTGNAVRQQMGVLLEDNLKQIGINMTSASLSWADYLDRIYDRIPGGRNMLSFFFIGWGPDYNDPDNFISPLYSNTSASNEAQVNDPWLQTTLTAAKQSVNSTLRAELYSQISDYLQNTLVPWIYVYQGWNMDVWIKSLSGYNANAMDKHYFGTAYFGLPGAAIPIPTFGIVLAIFSAVTVLTIVENKKLRK